VIDLRSDTVTLPSPAMRQAMATAEVGDDVLSGDPTTNALESRVAELLGMDWAWFCPTGTMANQVGIGLTSRHGTEVLLDAEAHIVAWEMAGAAALWGLQVRPVRPAGYVMTSAELKAAFRAPSRHAAKPSLVVIENTHNGAGGLVTSLAEMHEMATIAREHGCMVHLDGARLWNAAVALDTDVATLASVADTVMVCLSKGLGAPVGSCIAGRGLPSERGWEYRKRLGGGMRQSGILAAAARYGLEHNRDRLVEDHVNAKAFAALVDGKGGAKVVPPDTNIVMIDLPAGRDAYAIERACLADNVRVSAWHWTRLRAITHLDVTRAEVERAAAVVAHHLEAGT
jgi:threonine aldolase